MPESHPPDQRTTASSVGFAAIVGALAGAALAGRRGARAAVAGGLAGAAMLGASERVARARQKPGEIPPIWQRIAVSAALAAPIGWVAGRAQRPLAARRRCRRRRRRGGTRHSTAEGRDGPDRRSRRRMGDVGRRSPTGACGRGERIGAGVSRRLRADLPRRSGHAARRAGRPGRSPLRRPTRRTDVLRRHRIRQGVGGVHRRRVCRRRARRRHRRVDRRARGAGLRSRGRSTSESATSTSTRRATPSTSFRGGAHGFVRAICSTGPPSRDRSARPTSR